MDRELMVVLAEQRPALELGHVSTSTIRYLARGTSELDSGEDGSKPCAVLLGADRNFPHVHV